LTGPARGFAAARHAAAMHFRLRTGLSFCFVGERTIFLDLRDDRYFCLGPELENAFHAWAASGEASADAAAVLARHRLLEPAEEAESWSRPSHETPKSSLLDLPIDRLRPGPVTAAFAKLLEVSIRLRLGTLERMAERLRRQKTRPGSALDPQRSARIAHAHETAALFTASHDKCLWRSLALAEHLSRTGLACELFLGVRLRPFQAHCWVQVGDAVANDRVETVRTFTPILVI
jgi:hypothetical protein